MSETTLYQSIFEAVSHELMRLKFARLDIPAEYVSQTDAAIYDCAYRTAVCKTCDSVLAIIARYEPRNDNALGEFFASALLPTDTEADALVKKVQMDFAMVDAIMTKREGAV